MYKPLFIKKILNVFTLFFLLFINEVSFGQSSDLDGVWYFIDDSDRINIRIFQNNQTMTFNFTLNASSQYSIKPMTSSFAKYTIESIGRINVNGKTTSYKISPQMLIFWESPYPGALEPRFYHPVLEAKFESLIGNWIVTGDEYDTEVEITSTTLTIKKGKVQRSYTYSSGGYPVINFKDSSGKTIPRNYFFFGRDIVALYIPDERNAQIFQRVPK